MATKLYDHKFGGSVIRLAVNPELYGITEVIRVMEEPNQSAQDAAAKLGLADGNTASAVKAKLNAKVKELLGEEGHFPRFPKKGGGRKGNKVLAQDLRAQLMLVATMRAEAELKLLEEEPAV